MHASHSHHQPQGAGTGPVTRRSLSASRQQLLLLLQRIRFGRVHSLRVRAGEPDLGAVRWTRTVKVTGENRPHPASRSDDFELRQEVRDFFRLLAELGDGEVANLEVRNGLPFTFEVNESLPG